MRLKVLVVVYYGATLFCLLDAVLILLSLALADHPRISNTALIASASIATLFFAIGYVAYRISNYVRRVCRLLDEGTHEPAVSLNMRGLMTYLIGAGLILATTMALLIIAFVGRMNDGFAIFG